MSAGYNAAAPPACMQLCDVGCQVHLVKQELPALSSRFATPKVIPGGRRTAQPPAKGAAQASLPASAPREKPRKALLFANKRALRVGAGAFLAVSVILAVFGVMKGRTCGGVDKSLRHRHRCPAQVYC